MAEAASDLGRPGEEEEEEEEVWVPAGQQLSCPDDDDQEFYRQMAVALADYIPAEKPSHGEPDGDVTMNDQFNAGGASGALGSHELNLQTVPANAKTWMAARDSSGSTVITFFGGEKEKKGEKTKVGQSTYSTVTNATNALGVGRVTMYRALNDGNNSHIINRGARPRAGRPKAASASSASSSKTKTGTDSGHQSRIPPDAVSFAYSPATETPSDKSILLKFFATLDGTGELTTLTVSNRQEAADTIGWNFTSFRPEGRGLTKELPRLPGLIAKDVGSGRTMTYDSLVQAVDHFGRGAVDEARSSSHSILVSYPTGGKVLLHRPWRHHTAATTQRVMSYDLSKYMEREEQRPPPVWCLETVANDGEPGASSGPTGKSRVRDECSNASSQRSSSLEPNRGWN